MLWLAPETAARALPVSLFGGRVLGCWLMFGAVLALWTVIKPVPNSPALAIAAALPWALLLAGLRFPDALWARSGLLPGAGILVVLGALAAIAGARQRHVAGYSE